MITSTFVSKDKLKKSKKLEKETNTWIDVVNPTSDELSLLSKHLNISKYKLERSLDEEERSRLTIMNDHIYIAYQAPYYKKDEIITISFGLFIKNNSIITLRNHKIVSLNQIDKLPDEKLKEILTKGSWYFLYYLLDEINDNYFAVSEQIGTKLNELEDTTVDEKQAESMDSFFDIKKTLIYIHKSLIANREVLAKIEKENIKELKKDTKAKLKDIYTDIVQLLDVLAINREILTSIAEIHASNVSNSMNNVMKKLTVYASFVLVPTLISGIYGMNFRHMPELYWTYGYVFSLGIMVLSVILLYTYFKLKKWI